MSVIRYYEIDRAEDTRILPERHSVLTVPEFRARLVHRVAADKNNLAMVPADFAAPATRNGPSVKGACASVFMDFDDIPEDTWASVLVELRQYEAEAWTTHSHGDPAKPGVRARVRLTLDRDQTADEITPVRRAVAKALGAAVDKKSLDPSRLFYQPAVAAERRHLARVWTFDGPVRPSVDELAAEGHEVKRSEIEARLAAAGRITQRQVTELATAEDKAAAETWLAQRLEWIVKAPDGVNARGFVIGSVLKATVAVGGLPESSVEQVADAIRATGHKLETRLKAFYNGVDIGTLPPIRAYDAVVDAAVDESRTEARLRAQLSAPMPPEVEWFDDIAALRTRLQAVIFAVSAFGGPRAVVVAPPGAGKSHGLGHLLNTQADLRPFCVLGPEHAVGTEVLRHVTAQGSREKCLQLHNPMVKVAGSPPCLLEGQDLVRAKRRRDVLKHSQYKICAGCPKVDACEARPAWVSRNRRASAASATILASYKGADAFERHASDDAPRTLLIDEMFPAFDAAQVSKADLVAARKHPLADIQTWCASIERGHGWPTDDLNLSAEESPEMLTIEAAALSVVAFVQAARGSNATVTKTPDGWLCVSESTVRRLYREHGGVVFTATPNHLALEGVVKYHHLAVRPSANHTRIVFPMFESRKRDLVPTNEAAVRQARESVELLSAQGGAGRKLFITFKALAQFVAAQEWCPDDVDVAWYGAQRGKNDWETHTGVFCLGTPYMKHHDDGVRLGADGYEYAQGMAADEIEQGVGRIRADARPDVKLFMAVRAAVAPRWWRAAETTVAEWGKDGSGALGALVEAAVVRLGSAGAVARRLGTSSGSVSEWRSGRKPVPAKHEAALREALGTGLFG